MSTEFPTKNGINRQWHVIDAEDVVLGKLASKAAMILMGKTNPVYTPFLDTGDHVIVINAAKVKLTGRKEEQKLYRRFTGYPGGLVEMSLKRVRAKSPTAWWRMPSPACCRRPSWANRCIRKLKVYAGDKHPHEAQKPVALTIK